MTKKNPVQKATNHFKNKCIKMETMKENALYAFTFSPSDLRSASSTKMLKNEIQAENVLVEHILEWTKYLRKMRFCNFEVYPEFSTLGRLHFHGYIQPTNILMFYFHDLYLLNQYSYEVDTIGKTDNDITVCQEYRVKQSNHFKAFCEKHKIDYKICNKERITQIIKNNNLYDEEVEI